MLIDGKKFHGSTSYVEKHETLCTIAGYSSWFTEFQPVCLPDIQTFHRLLFIFYQHRLCFFFTGSFVGFIAGFLNSFRAVSFFIILDDHPIIRLIFQKGESIIQNFNIGSFQFDLMQMLNDSCIYRVRNENFNMLMFFYGIDTDSRCNYCSNVNFVHFIWDYFEGFSIRKFAITLLPKDSSSTPPHLFDILLKEPGCCICNITEQLAMIGGRIEKIVMNVSSEIV